MLAWLGVHLCRHFHNVQCCTFSIYNVLNLLCSHWTHVDSYDMAWSWCSSPVTFCCNGLQHPTRPRPTQAALYLPCWRPNWLLWTSATSCCLASNTKNTLFRSVEDMQGFHHLKWWWWWLKWTCLGFALVGGCVLSKSRRPSPHIQGLKKEQFLWLRWLSHIRNRNISWLDKLEQHLAWGPSTRSSIWSAHYSQTSSLICAHLRPLVRLRSSAVRKGNSQAKSTKKERLFDEIQMSSKSIKQSMS